MDLDDARALAIELMGKHGLQDWRFVFDNAKTRAGVCRPGRKEIGLSRPLTALHPAHEVQDTILHEIAHAIVGPEHGHNDTWRATAKRIGCTGTRCVPEDAPKVDGAWVGTCPAGHQRSAHRRPERVKSCSQCSKTFTTAAIFTWTHRGHPAPMHPNYEAELARIQGKRPANTEAGGTVLAPSLTLRIGDQVELNGGGKFGGLTGTIESRGRTRYQVRTSQGVISAPFALVRPLQSN